MRMRLILALGLVATLAICLVFASPPGAAGDMKATTNPVTVSAAPTMDSVPDGPMAIMNDDIATALDSALSDHFYMIANDRNGGVSTPKEPVAILAHRVAGQYRGDSSASVTLHLAWAYRV